MLRNTSAANTCISSSAVPPSTEPCKRCIARSTDYRTWSPRMAEAVCHSIHHIPSRKLISCRNWPFHLRPLQGRGQGPATRPDLAEAPSEMMPAHWHHPATLQVARSHDVHHRRVRAHLPVSVTTKAAAKSRANIASGSSGRDTTWSCRNAHVVSAPATAISQAMLRESTSAGP